MPPFKTLTDCKYELVMKKATRDHLICCPKANVCCVSIMAIATYSLFKKVCQEI